MTADPTPDKPPSNFHWDQFAGGLLLALVVGAIASVFFSLIGALLDPKFLMAVFAAIPGAGFMILSGRAGKNGRAQGFLIGGCIIGLIGGACGAIVSRL